MKKQIAVFSVILGLLAFTLPPLAGQDEPGPAPVPEKGPGRGLQRWLDLTPDQQAKLEEIRKLRQEAMKGFGEEHQKMRQEMKKLLADPKADQKKIEGLIDDLAKLQATRMKSNMKLRQEFEKVLTPQQLEKLRKAKANLQGMRRGSRFLGRHPGMRRFLGNRFFGRPGRMGFRHPGMRERMLWDW
jgi:Spy/CpxP family protein refolding chaperone